MKRTILNIKWWEAAGIRAIKTAAQAFVATVGTTAIAMSEVNWGLSVSAAALAGILSLATSLAGLPETEDSGAKISRNDDDRSDKAGMM